MDSLVEGTRLCPFPITANGHGRVAEPENDQFCDRYLGMIPKEAHIYIFLRDEFFSERRDLPKTEQIHLKQSTENWKNLH